MNLRCARPSSSRVVAGFLLAVFLAGPPCAAKEFRVKQAGDSGRGSLRQAILDANREPGADVIRFDSVDGPFGVPRTIRLKSALPVIADSVEIDGYIPDRLWKPSGVTLDGAGQFRVFEVAASVPARLRYLTVMGGRAAEGGGLLSAGETRVENMLFERNAAESGGAIAQSAGTLWLINSTLIHNEASVRGGGVSIGGGRAVLTQCTLARNRAPVGAGMHNSGELTLANTIIAHSGDGPDCHSTRPLDPRSTHNLIQREQGCGKPFLTADPRLGEANYYNGPTRSAPLQGGSPAINWGDIDAAVDADGQKLLWDQRGSGDPRFVAGIPDIGAFEQQPVVSLEVDVAGDVDLRGCTTMEADCSLRGAIAIANASPRHDAITFRPAVFGPHPTLALAGPLPRITKKVSLSAGNDITVRITGSANWVSTAPGVELDVRGVVLPQSKP